MERCFPPRPGTLVRRTSRSAHREVYFELDFASAAPTSCRRQERCNEGYSLTSREAPPMRSRTGRRRQDQRSHASSAGWYQDQYQGVWWVRAQERELLLRDLVELVERFSPAIAELAKQDLEKAAGKGAGVDREQFLRAPVALRLRQRRTLGRRLIRLLPRRNADVVITSPEQEFHGAPIADVMDVDGVLRCGHRLPHDPSRSQGRAASRGWCPLGRRAADLPLALDHAGA